LEDSDIGWGKTVIFEEETEMMKAALVITIEEYTTARKPVFGGERVDAIAGRIESQAGLLNLVEKWWFAGQMPFTFCEQPSLPLVGAGPLERATPRETADNDDQEQDVENIPNEEAVLAVHSRAGGALRRRRGKERKPGHHE
jgi:hypothetical protein